MIGSLWTGISGLATHQSALDNESHNISNVNTIGYKASRISFADQMYQDQIGKGNKIVAAERIFTQGNMKSTGVAYDVALEGRGYLAVKDPNATGSAEEYYTRSGNLRMGESGNLQDANSFDVIGWGIPMPDTSVGGDVTTTNSNITNFTNDYTKIAANQIIKHKQKVETITGKLTDYTSSAKSDSMSVFTGLGYKSMGTKVTDVEMLITEYQDKLSTYAQDPSVNSSPSTSQRSAVQFPTATTSQLTTESDQLYIYIDGVKYSQNYIDTTAPTGMDTTADLNGSGGSDATDDNILASRMATYRALADQISKIPGLVAYLGDPALADISNPSTTTWQRVQGNANDVANTAGQNFLAEPILVIESLVPGKEFVVGDVAEYIASSGSLVPGSKATVDTAVEGTGYGAVKSARDALVEVAAAYQRDIWGISDFGADATDFYDTVTFTLTDPTDSTNSWSVSSTGAQTSIENTVDDIVSQINADSNMNQYVKAYNYNGNLVIEPLTAGETFVAALQGDNASTGAVLTTTPININKNSTLSVNSGADAEFLEMVNTLDQTSSRDSIQLRLDNLGISDSAFGEFNIDSTGLITMKQDGAEFAVGQVSVAMFNNERGLKSEGNNLLSKTNDSGNPIYNINNDKAAKVAGKTLELSTADLSESLVNLMVFQRAFEANSKSITTSDQILTTLIQLKK